MPNFESIANTLKSLETALAIDCIAVEMSGNHTNHSGYETPAKDDFYLVTSTWPASAVILTAVLIIIVDITAIIGNVFVIGALAKIDALKTIANNQAVISLALADLLVGVLVMPCAIDSVMAGKWRCGHLWGKVNAFGNFSFCISSIMHLALLSVDRYIAISRPLIYSSVVTKERTRAICLFLWICSTVWALPSLFGVISYECFIPYLGKCLEEDWLYSEGAVLFTALVVSGAFGVAVLVMCFAYAKIYVKISKQAERLSFIVKQLRTNSNSGVIIRTHISAKKGALTVFIVIGSCVACWSPFCLLLFAQMAHGKTTGGRTADIITMFFGFANSAFNPIIYCIRYRVFRETVKRMFVKKRYCIQSSFSR